SSASKRTLEDRQVRFARKRQKQEPVVKNSLKPVQDHDQVQDGTFRFMDLPGELRNRIYEHAVEHTHRLFPPIFVKEKPRARRGRSTTSCHSSFSSSNTAPTGAPLAIPFIALTQTCTRLRSEFRPVWLATHKIPLCALDGYLKTFYPAVDPRISPEAQRRLETQFSPNASLRLWIRRGELGDVDIIRLLKHMTRFPNFKVTCQAFPDVDTVTLGSIQALIDNKNSSWISWIKNTTISQVRLLMRGFSDAGRPVRVVIKERYAPQWMKPTLNADTHVPPGYVDNLGLGEVAKQWRIAFGVDYS
ncbi:hypothetical protein BKA63DRAFT_428200, partial [Paraphoma chrysanthemicola]